MNNVTNCTLPNSISNSDNWEANSLFLLIGFAFIIISGLLCFKFGRKKRDKTTEKLNNVSSTIDLTQSSGNKLRPPADQFQEKINKDDQTVVYFSSSNEINSNSNNQQTIQPINSHVSHVYKNNVQLIDDRLMESPSLELSMFSSSTSSSSDKNNSDFKKSIGDLKSTVESKEINNNEITLSSFNHALETENNSSRLINQAFGKTSNNFSTLLYQVNAQNVSLGQIPTIQSDSNSNTFQAINMPSDQSYEEKPNCYLSTEYSVQNKYAMQSISVNIECNKYNEVSLSPQNSNRGAVGEYVSNGSANGNLVYEGARSGLFYWNSNGNKCYVTADKVSFF